MKNYLHYVRGIDEDIIEAFADENMIYESADYHNAIFVGYDKNGIPLHANKRGIGKKSTFKGNVESSMDELQFVSSLISIEDYFKIELPDEFLVLENVYNLDAISEFIYELLQKNNSN